MWRAESRERPHQAVSQATTPEAQGRKSTNHWLQPLTMGGEGCLLGSSGN